MLFLLSVPTAGRRGLGRGRAAVWGVRGVGVHHGGGGSARQRHLHLGHGQGPNQRLDDGRHVGGGGQHGRAGTQGRRRQLGDEGVLVASAARAVGAEGASQAGLESGGRRRGRRLRLRGLRRPGAQQQFGAQLRLAAPAAVRGAAF